MTPVHPRLTATLIEPQIAELLRQHDLAPERVFSETKESLTQLLAARAIPIEGKRKLASAGNALDAELEDLLTWMRSLDEGLGRSAETAASKMRYQMNRLRRLAANFQLQKEASLARHAEAITQALHPEGGLQERAARRGLLFRAPRIRTRRTTRDHGREALPRPRRPLASDEAG